MTLEFDDANLESVANLILITNPHAADRWDLSGLIFNMRAMAAGNVSEKLGFVSTAGYMLTYFRADGDTIGVRASITGFNVQKFLESKGLYNV